MGSQSIDFDTIPCPPPDECFPESGEHPRTGVRAAIRSSHPAPRFAQTIEEDLRERLAGIRCTEHDRPALVELAIADDGGVQVIPIGCCDQVNRLVLAALRESVTLTPPCAPELQTPCETGEDYVRVDAAAGRYAKPRLT